VIESVTPNWGQFGTRVTIFGTNLLGGGSYFSNITLRGIPVIDVVSFNNSYAIVTAASFPSSHNETGAVTLQSNTFAQVTRANSWTYVSEASFLSISPTTIHGGTFVTLVGTGL